MKNISQKIKQELKRVKLIQGGLKYVEQNRIKTRFFDEFENNMSVYELTSMYETPKGGQITGMVTISICDLFMKWLMLHGNDYLKKVGSELKICNRCNENNDNSPEFDVCFEIDNQKCFFEIKFSQNNNSTQGATHGKNKVDNFIIIEFKFDMYRVITEDNTGILGNVWIGTTLKKPNFMGIATEKSSRTRFEYTYSEYDIEDMEMITILGNVSKKQKGSKKYNLIGGNIYN
jgi:hypothetical protein